MARIDNLEDVYAELKKMRSDINKLGTANPLASSSLTHGRLRIGGDAILLVDSSGGLVVHGSINGDGTITWSGAFTLSGTTNLTGPTNLTGTTKLTGDTTQQGPFHVQGTTDLTGNLQVNSPGKITVAGGASPAVLADGSLTFGTGAKLEADGAGARLISGGSGPRLYVFPTAIGIQYDPTHFVQVTGGGVTVKGGLSTDTLSTSSSKQFAIPHPTKPGMTLRHGSTESPVSGIEYWGDETLADDGRTEVQLPDYFEALAKVENRAVFVTGRGFAADWTDIENGTFVVRGEPGGRFSWQVKAERRWADFETEDATAE